ncbi:keratin, type II microfibrillar, component 7C [Anolis carolinensis]|uniref:keratin, type II microfibrillar, component 7C n=1 Tax=Anolis carolinensis TaxID=28377 RepID=UPI002F2B2DA0
MDNSRGLNMDCVMEVYRRQFEEISSRSRAEAEAWCRCQLHGSFDREQNNYSHSLWHFPAIFFSLVPQYQELKTTAAKHCDNLRHVKEELSEITRVVHRLESEVSNVKAQCTKLEEEVAAAEERGGIAVKDARCKLVELEDALHKAKQDMACQLREYQDLMNMKMGLDIEITTYKKLLDGEELRMGDGDCAVNISVRRSQGAVVGGSDPRPPCGPHVLCGPNKRTVTTCGPSRERCIDTMLPCTAAHCMNTCSPSGDLCSLPRGFSCESGKCSNIKCVTSIGPYGQRY